MEEPEVSLVDRMGSLAPALMALGGGGGLHPVPDCSVFCQLQRSAAAGISHVAGKWRKIEGAAGVCTGVFITCQLIHAGCAVVRVCHC